MTSEKIQRLIYALDEALKTGDHAKEYTARKWCASLRRSE